MAQHGLGIGQRRGARQLGNLLRRYLIVAEVVEKRRILDGNTRHATLTPALPNNRPGRWTPSRRASRLQAPSSGPVVRPRRQAIVSFMPILRSTATTSSGRGK